MRHLHAPDAFMPLDIVERRYIYEMLEKTGGRNSQAFGQTGAWPTTVALHGESTSSTCEGRHGGG